MITHKSAFKLIKKKKYGEAEKQLSSLLAAHSNDSMLLMALGYVHAEGKKDHEKALNSYLRITKINPKLYRAWNAAGRCYFELKRFPLALVMFKKAKSFLWKHINDNSAEMAETRNNKKLSKKFMKGHVKWLRKKERAYFRSLLTLTFCLSITLFILEEISKACDEFIYLEKLLEIFPRERKKIFKSLRQKTPEIFYHVAKRLYKEADCRYDMENVKDYFLAVPEFDENYSKTLHHLGFLYEHYLFKRKKAISYYTKYLEVMPFDAIAWIELGKIYLDENKFLAHEYFNKALDIDDNNAESWYLYGISVSYWKHYEIAIKYLKKSLEIDDSCKNVWLDLGNLFYKQKKFVDARDSFLKALEIDPNFSKASKRLQKLHKKQHSKFIPRLSLHRS